MRNDKIIRLAIFILLITFSSKIYGQYYWVGDDGNWSNFSNHWATTSGGTTFHSTVPTINDTVIFDANSFSIASQTVTLDIVGICNSMDFTDATNDPTIAGTNALTIYNRMTLIDAMTFTISGDITFSSTDDITINLGAVARTLPNLNFPNSSGTIQILTGSVANKIDRVTFGDITASTNGVTFYMGKNTVTSNVKTFGNISLPNNCEYRFTGPHGASFGGSDANIFAGTFTVGSNGDGLMRGRYMDHQGTVSLGTDGDIRWVNHVKFDLDLNIAGSNSNHIQFSNDMQLGGDLNLTGNCSIIFDELATLSGDVNVSSSTVSSIRIDQATTIAGEISIAVDGELAFTNTDDVSPSLIVTGTTTLSDQATFVVGDGVTAPYTFADIICGNSTELSFSNGTAAVSLDNLTIGNFNIVQFNALSSGTTFSGDITSNGSCSNWRILRSDQDGIQAALSFGSAQTVSGNLIKDLAVSGDVFTANAGINDGNNSGITFNGSHTPTTLYWVAGNSGNWSDVTSWSTTSGGTSGSCLPGASDDVIFDTNSFSGADPSFTLDFDQAFVNNIDWSAVNTAVRWEGAADNDLIIFGNTNYDMDITNNFLGAITFKMISAGSNTVTSNGGVFNADLEFDFTGGTWILTDNLDINGDNADLIITNGTLSSGANTITIENDWAVDTGGAFDAGTSTVIFDGEDSSEDQYIDAGGSAFYNLSLDRASSADLSFVRLTSVMTVDNDLTIAQGRLADEGFQITGNATGTLSISNGERLRLGTGDVATTFPTNFTNIALSNTSVVEYHSQLDQDIAGGFTYGRVFIQGGGNVSRNKTLQAPITINREFRIDDYNDFFDNGFQITGTAGQTFRMDANTSFTIGTSVATSQFPTNYDVFNIDANSTIIYASGLDDNQTIKDLNGGDIASYANLTLTNASGIMHTKNMDGNIEVRGDLTVQDANTLDATVSNYVLELQAGLTLSGTGNINFRNGSLTIEGSMQQTLDFGGSTGMLHDLILNNTSSVILSDNISITGSVDFQDGIIIPLTTESISMAAGSSVVSVSDASFFDGVIEKTGGTAFTFPIGSGSSYHPISISGSGTATDAFQAQYFPTDPNSSFPRDQKDVILETINSQEYWTLDVSNGSPTVNVTLSWNASNDISNLADLRVAHWDAGGTNWDDFGNDGTTGNTTIGTITSSGVSTFSPFTLASVSSENPLPVDWLFFNANYENEKVNLNWATAVEINNDYFTIQRSSNGSDWNDLGKINGAGNINTIQYYNYQDLQPIGGVSYYRITQTDFDGKFEFSQVRAVECIVEPSINIYPNPVSNLLNIESVDLIDELTIMDVRGMEVTPTLNDLSGGKIDISELSKGIYFLKINFVGTQVTRRLVIK